MSNREQLARKFAEMKKWKMVSMGDYPIFVSKDGNLLSAFEYSSAILDLMEAGEKADRIEEQLADERDAAEEMCGNLSRAIATHFGADIGEHSNLNEPWKNALQCFEGKHSYARLTAANQGMREALTKIVQWDITIASESQESIAKAALKRRRSHDRP